MATSEVWKSREGRIIDGKFLLRQWLGGSDHSAVFLTERGARAEKAAIKLIAAGSVNPEHQLAQWHAAAQLSDPNLIRIFESGHCQMDGAALLYVVMEHADEDLSQILPQRPLEAKEVGDMLPPLLSALSYLHGKGFIHGRIRPSNVLAAGDQLKLSTDQAIPLSSTTEKKRGDVYDAPEVAAGHLSPASDVWSLGITLVVSLTQTVPRENSNGEPEVPPSIPQPFAGIVRDCLHLAPKQRCTIPEIMHRLKPVAGSIAVDKETEPEHPKPARRGLIAGSAIVAALVIASVFFYSHRENTSSSQAAPASSQAQSESQPPPAPSASAAAAPVSEQPAHSDSPGSVSKQILPDISAGARKTIRGRIKIVARVEVDPTGKVTRARLTTPGPSNYFARLTLNAAEHWQFAPPEIDGQPTSSAWALRFSLTRRGTEVSPEPLRR